jgi:glycosyltransferase involved in cell wall biosynthesis
MKFSVIIPTFNAAGYLPSCLESVAHQDLPCAEFETLVVDDGSTDETTEIASTFSNKLVKVRVFRSSENHGPGIARNIGLDHARGDFILFLDSDDTLTPDCLSSIQQVIDQGVNAELDAVGFDWAPIHSTGELDRLRRTGRRDGHFLCDRRERIRQYLSHRMDGSVIYTAVRRDLLDRFGIRFAAGLHEDVDFIFKVYFHSRGAYYLPRILYGKRNHDSSIVNTISRAHIKGYFRAWKSIGSYLTSQDLKPEEALHLRDCYRYGSAGVLATRVREVVRRTTDPEQMSELFELILRLSGDSPLYQEAGARKTVYLQIAELFLEVMNSSALDSTEKTVRITNGVRALEGRSWSCQDLHHSVYLGPDEIRTCCKRFFVDGEMRGDVVLFRTEGKHDGAVTPQRILDAKRQLHLKINSGEASPCDGCPFLEFRDWSPLNSLDISYLSLEYHSVCNLKCTYCSDIYYGGKRPSYDPGEVVDQLLASESLSHCSLVVWGGGEPVLGSEFDRMLAAISAKLPAAQQRVLTNAVKRSTVLETLLAAQKAQIVTSIDAGTKQTFTAIRGKNRLTKVCANLRSYAQANNQRVTVKYIFTEGNESASETRSFVDVMKEWDLLGCNFQISSDFKEEHISATAARSMLLMYGLLLKAGCQTVYFDELLRHRLGSVVDINDSQLIDDLHDDVGLDFVALPSQYPKVLIWGAGQQAKYLLEGCTFFKSAEPLFLVDSTPEKIGTTLLGREIRHPEALRTNDLPVIIAAVQGYPLILEQYRALGLPDSRLLQKLII